MDVTCLCNTHGRPFLVNEALESYLRNDRSGLVCEFLIVNDCPEQELTSDHHEVRIINLADPIEDYCDKQNYGVRMSCGKVVMLWDDDDIFLPWRIHDDIETLLSDVRTRAIAPSNSWFWDNGIITGRGRRPHRGAATFYREHYLKSGGAVQNQPPDASAWSNMSAAGHCTGVYSVASKTSLVYRWHGTGSCHDSDCTVKARTNAERHRVFRSRVMASPQFVRGKIELAPGWKQDYVQLVNDAIRDGKGEVKL